MSEEEGQALANSKELIYCECSVVSQSVTIVLYYCSKEVVVIL